MRSAARQFFKVCAPADALLSGTASLLRADRDRCLSGAREKRDENAVLEAEVYAAYMTQIT